MPRSAPSRSGRAEIKAVVDRAIGLERELWSGEPAPGERCRDPRRDRARGSRTWRGRSSRTRAAATSAPTCGSTADEILLADGLAVGEGAAEQRGGTTEWDLTPIDADEVELGVELERLVPEAGREPEPTPEPEARPEPGQPATTEGGFEFDPFDWQGSELDARISSEPSPQAEDELVIERARESLEGQQARQGGETDVAGEQSATASLELIPNRARAGG